MKNSPMLVTRKRETVWIRRSLTTPVKSRAMSSSMLMTLAGKPPEAGRRSLPRQAQGKDQAEFSQDMQQNHLNKKHYK